MSRLICSLSLALLVVPAAAHAGTLSGPTKVTWEVQQRLVQRAASGEAAALSFLRVAVGMMQASGADWQAVARDLDTRAKMVEMQPTLAKKVPLSFGATPATLRMAASAIRKHVQGNPPPAPAPGVKPVYRWIEIAYLPKPKQSAYVKEVREAWHKAASDGRHPGSFGSTVHTPGDAVVLDLRTIDRSFLTRMVKIARDVGKRYGARW